MLHLPTRWWYTDPDASPMRVSLTAAEIRDRLARDHGKPDTGRMVEFCLGRGVRGGFSGVEDARYWLQIAGLRSITIDASTTPTPDHGPDPAPLPPTMLDTEATAYAATKRNHPSWTEPTP